MGVEGLLCGPEVAGGSAHLAPAPLLAGGWRRGGTGRGTDAERGIPPPPRPSNTQADTTHAGSGQCTTHANVGEGDPSLLLTEGSHVSHLISGVSQAPHQAA